MSPSHSNESSWLPMTLMKLRDFRYKKWHLLTPHATPLKEDPGYVSISMTNQRQHIPRPHPHLSNEHRTKVATKLITLHPETPTRTWLAAAQPPLHTPPRLPRKTEKTCDIHLPTRQGHGPDRSIMTELSNFWYMNFGCCYLKIVYLWNIQFMYQMLMKTNDMGTNCQ